ncbi:MAG: LysM peptidoglycan-binding domain-containing protein [Deltaproteobacteria bacterium]|nr:MAG: LysM peptidoglycan-binding domain-containing protein [Deltaproteobacteria bacterium]
MAYVRRSARAQDETTPTTSSTLSTENTSTVEGLSAATPATEEGRTEQKGGGDHTVVRGDTLWGIAEATYGSGRYWRHIMRANEGSVFRGGDLIIVGTKLTLPELQVRVSNGVESEPTQEAREGGFCEAVMPREVCTEYGNFAVYPDDFTDDLPENADGVEYVRETRYTEILEDRVAEADEQRETTEQEVTDLLSYGLFDWAITDEEALSAYRKLAALPTSQLARAVGNISTIDRLLENLPSSVQSDPNYSRVLIALGPDRVAPYLNALLSTSLFDWFVSESDARAVMAVISVVDSGSRRRLLSRVSAEKQQLLLQTLPARGSALSDANKAAVRDIFFGADDGAMTLKCAAFETRFNLVARGDDGADWDAPTLDRSWEVLEALPPGHIEGNPELLQWIRYGDTGNGGWYDDNATYTDGVTENPDYRGAGFNIGTNKIDNANGSAEVGDPLHGVTRFNKVIRHEVGHAVDSQINGAATYCIGNAAGGDWKVYGTDIATFVGDMVADSGGAIDGLPGAQKTAVLGVLVAAATPGDTTTIEADLEALDCWGAIDGPTQASIKSDDAIEALTKGLDSPWYNHLPDGGKKLGDRIYQRSYDSKWSSYAHESRSRKVFTYQHRARGEWFAEAYATYYEPNADGSADGSHLEGVDRPTKVCFDNNVANVGMAPEEQVG